VEGGGGALHSATVIFFGVGEQQDIKTFRIWQPPIIFKPLPRTHQPSYAQIPRLRRQKET